MTCVLLVSQSEGGVAVLLVSLVEVGVARLNEVGVASRWPVVTFTQTQFLNSERIQSDLRFWMNCLCDVRVYVF